jgi:two-component system, NtrC family, sensor kinase
MDKPTQKRSPLAFLQSVRGLTLALLTVVLLIMLIIVNGSVYTFVFITEQQSWAGRQAEATQRATESIADFLARGRDVFSFINLEVEHEDGEELRELAEEILTLNPAFEEIMLLDSEGQIRADVFQERTVLGNLFTLSQSNWFLSARDGETYISELQFTSEREPYVILSAPLADGGVIGALLRMSSLNDQVAAIKFGATGDSYLAETDGPLLAHSEYQNVLNSTTIAGRPELANALAAPDNRWFGAYISFEGEPVVGSTARVPGTNWIVFSEISQTEAFSNSRTAISLLTGITVVFLVIVMWLSAQLLERFLFKPLDGLRVGTERVEQGNLNYQVPVMRSDEIGRVTDGFNVMVSQLRRRNEELRQARDEALVSTRLAQENSRLKSEFLSTMSHELRTPLNAIEGFTSIMLSGMGIELEPKAQNMVERVSANSKRLLALINDFLDLSRIESGRMELVSQPISPTKLVDKWKSQVGVLAEQKKLGFVVDIDPQIPPEILGDEDALSKIVVNLLSNAFKFTQEGQVSLTLRRQEENWSIEVTDTGIGIPPHAREYIFEEFRQVDGSSKRQFGGTGLGLAIVQKLARLMGGSVTLKSEMGKGSSFTVVLPLQAQVELA